MQDAVTVVGADRQGDDQVFSVIGDLAIRPPIRLFGISVNDTVLILGRSQLVKEHCHVLVQGLEFLFFFGGRVPAVVETGTVTCP